MYNTYPPPKSSRNQTIECVKLVAAISVVMLHCPFPGGYGWVIILLARFAVPFFFATSGYFNFQSDKQTVARRLQHILMLNIFASILYAVLNCIRFSMSESEIIFSEYINFPEVITTLCSWIWAHTNPFAEHLWYLAGIVMCYFFLWIHLCLVEGNPISYRSTYYGGAVLLLVMIFFTRILPLSNVYPQYDADQIHIVYRNGWFTGWPMFTLGLFLHEYQSRIIESFALSESRLVILILCGVLLMLAQYYPNIGGSMTIGILILIPALMLFLVTHPELPFENKIINAIVSRLGAFTTGLYILHWAIIQFYELTVQNHMVSRFGDLEPWLRPLLVLTVSFAAALIWERIDWLTAKYRRKKRSAAAHPTKK